MYGGYAANADVDAALVAGHRQEKSCSSQGAQVHWHRAQIFKMR
jgi:hypothetical protein